MVGVDPPHLRWTRRVGLAVPGGVGHEVLVGERAVGEGLDEPVPWQRPVPGPRLDPAR